MNKSPRTAPSPKYKRVATLLILTIIVQKSNFQRFKNANVFPIMSNAKNNTR